MLSEETIINKLHQGSYNTWYSNGKQNTTGNYKDDEKIGKWLYYNELGQILRQEMYKNGRHEGKWLTYYPQGPVESEINYKDGLKNGKTIYYEPNGKIIFEAVFKNNRLVKTLSGTQPEEKEMPKPKNDYDRE